MYPNVLQLLVALLAVHSNNLSFQVLIRFSCHFFVADFLSYGSYAFEGAFSNSMAYQERRENSFFLMSEARWYIMHTIFSK